MDKRLIWLGVGAFAVSTVGFVFSALLPAIAADTHITVPHAGYLITVFSLSYAIFTPLLSALAGAVDRRKTIVSAVLLFVAGNLTAALSSSFAALFAAQIVMGMAAGLFAATSQAAAVALVGPDHRARAIAVVLGGTTFAVALGAPAGSLISIYWGWRGTFLAIAALSIVCAAILWFMLPRDSRGSRLTLAERLTVITLPGVLPALLVTFLYLIGGFIVISYLAPLAIDGAGMSRAVLPGMLLAFGVGAVIGNMSSGQLSDRFGATRIVTLSLVCSTVICLGIASTLKYLPQETAGPVLIGLMVPWGVIGWMFPPAQASRLVNLAPNLAHLTLSLNASALYFGIAFGTLIGGRVLEFATPSDLGLVAAVFPVISLAVLAATRRVKEPVAA